MNRRNKELKLFADDAGEQGDENRLKIQETYTRFKHVVEKQHALLEQMIEHQFHAEDRPGLDMKLRVRKHLEGWDFRDVIATSKAQRVYPRIMVLRSLARGWVDFAAHIRAVTLFGRHFGDLIVPADRTLMCDHWARVPTGQTCLAIPVSTLRGVMALRD